MGSGVWRSIDVEEVAVIHSKKLVREDGTGISIVVELFETSNLLKWRVRVYVFDEQWCYWRDVYSIIKSESLPSNERPQYRKDCILKVVTLEEIYEAKMELLDMIKPKLGEI